PAAGGRPRRAARRGRGVPAAPAVAILRPPGGGAPRAPAHRAPRGRGPAGPGIRVEGAPRRGRRDGRLPRPGTRGREARRPVHRSPPRRTLGLTRPRPLPPVPAGERRCPRLLVRRPSGRPATTRPRPPTVLPCVTPPSPRQPSAQ